jgi:hypothetical protein
MKIQFLTWNRISECRDFKAWLYWKVFEGYIYGTFYRILGFEFRVK